MSTPGRSRKLESGEWARIDAQQRRLLNLADASIEEKLRRGQRLSAQAASLRRAIIHDEPSARRS
jgi:hypothetical protein